jgi:hypothetical protein
MDCVHKCTRAGIKQSFHSCLVVLVGSHRSWTWCYCQRQVGRIVHNCMGWQFDCFTAMGPFGRHKNSDTGKQTFLVMALMILTSGSVFGSSTYSRASSASSSFQLPSTWPCSPFTSYALSTLVTETDSCPRSSSRLSIIKAWVM